MRVRHIAVVAAVAGMLLAGAGPAGAARVGVAPPVAVPPAAVAAPTGMAQIVDVSADGRYALGRMTDTGPVVLRDLTRGRTVKVLASSPDYAYKSLSRTGRYIHYTRNHTRNGCTYARPWVLDRVTGKATLAAATRTGAPLKAAWTSPTQCPSISSTEAAFEMHAVGGPGQMSPDGRWVAFCANFEKPDRGDLYVKDRTTRKLAIHRGVCHLTAEAQEFHPVHVSESARTVMVLHNDAGSTLSYTADVLLKRGTLRAVVVPDPVGSQEMWLTDDGSAIYFLTGGSLAGRYDTSNAAVTTLAVGDPLDMTAVQPGDEYREQASMTRRGRYAAYHGSRLDPSLGRVGLVGVYDRATGTSVDLTGAVQAAGVPLQVGSPPVPNSLVPFQITSGGKVVFFQAPGGWMSLRWMP